LLFTTAILRAHLTIAEVPISHRPRSYAEGKKITYRDGAKGFFLIIKDWMGAWLKGALRGSGAPVRTAVILAAGKGKRMLPHTVDMPKSLLPYRGKPIIDHIFDSMPPEITEVTVVVGYLKEKMMQYLGVSYKGRIVRYAIQEEVRGSADALFCARPFLRQGERFAVLYGDEIPAPGEFRRCLSFPHSWLCFEVADPKNSGIARIAEDGRILEVVEKPAAPRSRIAAAGLMVVNTDIFRHQPEAHPSGERYLSSVMNKFIRDYPVWAVIGGKRPSFTAPEDLSA